MEKPLHGVVCPNFWLIQYIYTFTLICVYKGCSLDGWLTRATRWTSFFWGGGSFVFLIWGGKLSMTFLLRCRKLNCRFQRLWKIKPKHIKPLCFKRLLHKVTKYDGTGVAREDLPQPSKWFRVGQISPLPTQRQLWNKSGCQCGWCGSGMNLGARSARCWRTAAGFINMEGRERWGAAEREYEYFTKLRPVGAWCEDGRRGGELLVGWALI